MIQFTYTILSVSDIKRSVGFYAECGFELREAVNLSSE
jgi:predicted lactoylglutathione lyase